jgi:hypothetical protein
MHKHQEAFEGGELNAAHFGERIGMLRARLDALIDRDQVLAAELTANAPSAPDAASLRAVADRLDYTIANGARAEQGAACHAHRRASCQQPKRDPADLPSRRACGLRAERFSGQGRSQVENTAYPARRWSGRPTGPRGGQGPAARPTAPP